MTSDLGRMENVVNDQRRSFERILQFGVLKSLDLFAHPSSVSVNIGNDCPVVTIYQPALWGGRGGQRRH